MSEYRLARESAALFDQSQRGKVELTGKDAGRFLHNLSSNDITGLTPGTGCEAFLLNVQARVVAHVLVYRLKDRDAYWLDVDPGLAAKVIQHLDRYLISEDVALADRTRDFVQFHLAGPQAKALVAKEGLADLKELHLGLADRGEFTERICRHDPLGVPGYDILCPAANAAPVWSYWLDCGAQRAGPETYEILRVEAGTPVYGVDVDESNLAPEVGRTARAISYQKGCYLGQEPVVRIRDLGHVNRLLTGLKVAGEGAVPRGARLFRDAKEAGHVTSSVVSPGLGTAIALAYVRRSSTEPGTVVEVEVEHGRRTAEVVALPFIRS
jgi:folate-binding protein YgfZ